MMKYNTMMTYNLDRLIEVLTIIEDRLVQLIENSLLLSGGEDIDIGGYPIIDFEDYYKIEWASEIRYDMNTFSTSALERTKNYIFNIYINQ